MNDEKVLSITKKGLFVKSTLLSIVVLGIVLAKPVTVTVAAGAHKICQITMKSVEQCEKVC